MKISARAFKNIFTRKIWPRYSRERALQRLPEPANDSAKPSRRPRSSTLGQGRGTPAAKAARLKQPDKTELMKENRALSHSDPRCFVKNLDCVQSNYRDFIEFKKLSGIFCENINDLPQISGTSRNFDRIL